MKHKISIKEMRKLISAGEGGDPLVFLESVMSGQDIRKTSELFDLVEDIQQLTEGQPDKEDWSELYQFVNNNVKFKSPTISESLAAAKTLSEYLYPKRKQIDITGGTGAGNGDTEPLSIEEIELFKEKWNEEF
jgi:hypothetical protein